MSTTAVITHAMDRTILLGSVSAGIHGLFTASEASLALSFNGSESACGLKVGFHASTDEIRAYAAELLRHADITDAGFQGLTAAAGEG